MIQEQVTKEIMPLSNNYNSKTYKEMKRTTENFIPSRKLNRLTKKCASAVIQSAPFLQRSLQYASISSFYAIAQIIENVVEKVNGSIRQISEKRYYQHLIKKIEQQQHSLEYSLTPMIGDYDPINCPETEPTHISNDQICLREIILERKRPTHRSRTNVSSFGDLQVLTKIENIPKAMPNPLRFSIGEQLVPLHQISSQKDIKTSQMQYYYRQKCPQTQSSIHEKEIKPPNLLTAKRSKGEKETQFNFNFDYDGEKIPITSGIIQKNNQINILKTIYKFPKDKQEDVKGPKKVLQRISCGKLPQLFTKKVVTSSTEVYELKTGIEKTLCLKGCRLSSIKCIQELDTK